MRQEQKSPDISIKMKIAKSKEFKTKNKSLPIEFDHLTHNPISCKWIMGKQTRRH